jgi:magnesium-transporting ATPase (P-type)
VIIYAVATAVGTLPVTLILVLTITMAAGTKAMVQRNVVVRNMRSLEALGGVTSKSSPTRPRGGPLRSILTDP